MTIPELYKEAEKLINKFIREEMIAQGHSLTGTMEESLDSETQSKGNVETMTGLAVHYTKHVNDGFPAASASFKQFPFLLEYFIKRGYPVYSSGGGLTAGALAAMTIRKWMKEGMPSQASKRFSKTGNRTQMIESAFVANGHKIDEFLLNGYDFVVEERFQKEKSETV